MQGKDNSEQLKSFGIQLQNMGMQIQNMGNQLSNSNKSFGMQLINFGFQISNLATQIFNIGIQISYQISQINMINPIQSMQINNIGHLNDNNGTIFNNQMKITITFNNKTKGIKTNITGSSENTLEEYLNLYVQRIGENKEYIKNNFFIYNGRQIDKSKKIKDIGIIHEIVVVER